MASSFPSLSPTSSWTEICAADLGGGTALPHLSPAEQVVIHYLRQGLSNREIAQALGKAEATVKNQVSSCLRKLGVPNRGRAIALVR